jgi:hypothetical protein
LCEKNANGDGGAGRMLTEMRSVLKICYLFALFAMETRMPNQMETRRPQIHTHGSADREKGRYISSGIVMWICSVYLAPEYARPIVRNVRVVVTGRKKKGL